MWINNIYGHDKIVKALNKHLERDDLSHAILFDGIDGVGKKTVAEKLAKGLLCMNHDDCMSCPSCVQFDSGTNPDYLEILPVQNVIKKEDIEEISSFLSVKPFDAKYKVVIVDRFEYATVEAQNSLLKILEEPPYHSKIILLSDEADRLLDTIISRVQNFKFYPLNGKTIYRYLLDHYKLTEDGAKFISEFSNGSIGIAKKLATGDSLFEDRKIALDILDNSMKAQRKYVIENLGFFNEENIDSIIDLYLTWIKDLYFYKMTGTIKKSYETELESKIVSQGFLSIENIQNIYSKLIIIKEQKQYNISPEYTMEIFFIDIMEECKWTK